MLSSRASEYKNAPIAHGKRSLYHPKDNPSGGVSFSFAENWLIYDELNDFIEKHSKFDRLCVSYDEGFTGNIRLRTAVASHINAHFNPIRPVDAEDLTCSAGVTSLNETCAFLFCDHGCKDAIMLGTPIYGSFTPDMALRTGALIEYVRFGDEDQFDIGCVKIYEEAFNAAKARGVNVKAMVLCNPHNPLGRCYTREALVGLLGLCGELGIHLISDEIYALSVYEREGRRAEKFISVLSIDFEGLIDPNQVHVLYGMSKDLAASGMRLGCVVSRNEAFKYATRVTCRFISPSQFSQSLAASILENQVFVRDVMAKSRTRLARNRKLAETLLDGAGIKYYDEGNAGFYLWIDLGPFLPVVETNEDLWAAEMLLSKRFGEVNLWMAYGKGFHSPEPGRFRLIFGVDEETLREGIRRIVAIIAPTEEVRAKLVQLTYDTSV